MPNIPPVTVSAGDFHTYRVAVRDGRLRLWIDGQERLSTDRLDTTAIVQAWTPSRASVYGLAFGNERSKDWGNHDRAVVHPDLWEPNITPEVTGYSIWRHYEAAIGEPDQPPEKNHLERPTDGFPDQYQLDHIVEVEASVAGHDQGYSGWTLFPDGRLFVVNYTDDTAPLVQPGTGGGNARMGISWIRGTYVSPADLPPKITISRAPSQAPGDLGDPVWDLGAGGSGRAGRRPDGGRRGRETPDGGRLGRARPLAPVEATSADGTKVAAFDAGRACLAFPTQPGGSYPPPPAAVNPAGVTVRNRSI